MNFQNCSHLPLINFILILTLCFHGSSGGRPKDCSQVQNEGSGQDSSYQVCAIYPFGPEGESVDALCDFETDAGGWTLLQKRGSGPRLEFYQNWTEYEEGFGSVAGNFWIGLKTIHALTKDLDQELRIDLWDFEGGHVFAKYSNFSISDSLDFYRLSIGGYSGDAGDSMTPTNSYAYLNGMRFTTKDKDNDQWDDNNCAGVWSSAWWYNFCSDSNLNGMYFEGWETQIPSGAGIHWYGWKPAMRPLQQVEMKIRRRQK